MKSFTNRNQVCQDHFVLYWVITGINYKLPANELSSDLRNEIALLVKLCICIIKDRKKE